MVNVFLIAAAALALTFTPGDLLAVAGSGYEYETELLRFAGLVLFGQAVLVAQIKRKRITDERWDRIVLAGNVGATLGALYLGTGMQLLLVASFTMLFAVTLRTLMPVLDHWSADVRRRHDGNAS